MRISEPSTANILNPLYCRMETPWKMHKKDAEKQQATIYPAVEQKQMMWVCQQRNLKTFVIHWLWNCVPWRLRT